MARFCNKCGNPVTENFAFCNHCGNPLPVAPVATVEQPMEQPVAPVATVEQPMEQPMEQPVAPVVPVTPVAQPVYIPPVAPQPAKKTGGHGWLIAIIAAVAAIAILLVAIIGSGDNDRHDYDYDDPDAPKTSQTNNPDNPSNPTGNSGNGGGSISTQNITRTVMVYIVGSDLESRSHAATLDIQEMIGADIDTAKTRVLFYAGGSMYWHQDDIDPLESSIYLLEQDGIKAVNDTPVENMAEADTLTDFLDFCVEEYPADRYSLILWDHGGGPMEGYGHDEEYNDMMSVADLQTALFNSPFNKNQKLEMLGFDACLMASAECAWAFKDYAEYYVASEETEPGYGWDYAFLQGLHHCENGAQIGELIIDTYFAFYDQLFAADPRYESDLTLSCVDLSQVQVLESKINELFSDVNAEILNGKISEASRCRYRSKAFGKSTSTNTLDLIDLGHIATLLKAEYPTEAQALLDTLDNYVTYSRSNTQNVYGVSIYHPYDNAYRAPTYLSTFHSFGFAERYAEYINNFVNHVLAKGGGNGAYRDFSNTRGTVVTQQQKSDLSIQLTDDQLSTMAGAEYYVFYALTGETTFSGQVEYLQVFSGQDCTLSGNTLSATYDGKAVFGKAKDTGAYSKIPLSMYQIYDGTGEAKYYFPCMFWFFGDNLEMEIEPVNWLMKIKDGKPLLTNAYSMNDQDNNPLADKMMLDSEHYSIYTFANNAYTVTTDPNLGTQFTFTGSSYGVEYEKGTFDIEFRSIPDRENYYAVFAITDIYGNRYFSDFICLSE